MKVFVVTTVMTVMSEYEEACRDLIADALSIDGIVPDSVEISVRDATPED